MGQMVPLVQLEQQDLLAHKDLKVTKVQLV
jgi:hypothetical protein